LFGVAAAAFRFRFEDLLCNRYLFEDFLLILGVDFEKKSAIPSLILSFHEKYASSEMPVESSQESMCVAFADDHLPHSSSKRIFLPPCTTMVSSFAAISLIPAGTPSG